ncbi:MAG TPA: hypothetical protein VG291_18355 [Xanthobacteraceae bacterium]|nr:hypothetical protein [Xanthobacteraceae bacterium]
MAESVFFFATLIFMAGEMRFRRYLAAFFETRDGKLRFIRIANACSITGPLMPAGAKSNPLVRLRLRSALISKTRRAAHSRRKPGPCQATARWEFDMVSPLGSCRYQRIRNGNVEAWARPACHSSFSNLIGKSRMRFPVA